MKLNEHAMSEHLKAFGAAFVGAMLCVSMTALSTGSVVAHAEQGSGDEIAVLSAGTKDEFRGYIPTAKQSLIITHPDTNLSYTVFPGDYLHISEDNWIAISQYVTRKSSGAIYVSQANYAGVSGYVRENKEASTDTVTWWEVYEIVPDTTNETKATENKSAETTAPETNRTPTISDVDVPLTTPETVEKPTAPTPNTSVDPTPQDTTTGKQDSTKAESNLLSLQCRESEAAAKIAELEAQGYEIVRVEKLPKWWR